MPEASKSLKLDGGNLSKQREKKQKHAHKPKSIEIAESKTPKSNLKRKEKSTAPEEIRGKESKV